MEKDCGTSISVDLAKARAAVAAKASPLQQARLQGIFGASRPDREVVRSLERLQNPDGGFPAGDQPGAPSTLADTCRILFQLKQMPPLAGSPMASRAAAFLRRAQGTDGFWREGQDCLNLTAWAAYTIYTLEPVHVDPVARASRRLKEQAGGDGAGFTAQGLAAAWALWTALEGEPAPVARWAFRLLAGRQLSASDLACWLVCALEVGAGGVYLLPLAQQVADLAALQQPDGLWPSGERDAEADPVEVTLTALRVFSLCGLIQGEECCGGEGGT